MLKSSHQVKHFIINLKSLEFVVILMLCEITVENAWVGINDGNLVRINILTEAEYSFLKIKIM